MKVEVNGRRGILITIKTGSGQGDPLSNVLLLIGSEPINRHTANSFPELIYIPQEGIAIGFILFVGDNLSPLSLTCADKMDPVLTVYDNTPELVDSTSTFRNQLSCVSIFPGTQTGTAIYSIQTQHLCLELFA